MIKMAKKIPIETKAALLKYYYAEECSIQSLVKYALAKYDIDITRQSIMKWIKIKLGFLYIISLNLDSIYTDFQSKHDE